MMLVVATALADDDSAIGLLYESMDQIYRGDLDGASRTLDRARPSTSLVAETVQKQRELIALRRQAVRWHAVKVVDKMTDGVTRRAILSSVEAGHTLEDRFFSVLWIDCDDEGLSVWFDTAADQPRVSTARLRLDKSPAYDQPVSPDGATLDVLEPRAFVRSLLGAKQLLFEYVQPYGPRTVFTFRVEGLATVAADLLKQCPVDEPSAEPVGQARVEPAPADSTAPPTRAPRSSACLLVVGRRELLRDHGMPEADLPPLPEGCEE